MKKIFVKKIISISLVSIFILPVVYTTLVEPTIATAVSVSDSVLVTLTVDSGITITSPADVVMIPNLGISASSSIGNATWNVKTNHATGYSLGVKASSAPALVSGVNSFADYQTGVPTAWTLPATSYQFGFSAFGTNVSAAYGTGASCGSSGTPLGTLNYKGFTTSDTIIATQAVVTSPAGMDTTVCFAAGQNGVYAPSGVYTATITATATEI